MTRNTAFVLAALIGGFFTPSAKAGVVADELNPDNVTITQDGLFCGNAVETAQFVTGRADMLEPGSEPLSATAQLIKSEWEQCQAAGIRGVVVVDGYADGQRHKSHDTSQDVGLGSRRAEALRAELSILGVPTLAAGEWTGGTAVGPRKAVGGVLVLGTSLNYDATAARQLGVDLSNLEHDAEMIRFARQVSDLRQASCSPATIGYESSYDFETGQRTETFTNTRNPNTMGPALFESTVNPSQVRFAHRDATSSVYSGTKAAEMYESLSVVYDCPVATEGSGEMVWRGEMVEGVPQCAPANRIDLFQVASGGTVEEAVQQFFDDMVYEGMASSADIASKRVVLTDMCDTDADIEADRRDDRQSSLDDRATGPYVLAGAGVTASHISGTHEECDVSGNMVGADVIIGGGVGVGNGVGIEAFAKVSPTGLTGNWDEAHGGFVGVGGGLNLVTGLNGPVGFHLGGEVERMIVPGGGLGTLVEAPIGAEVHLSNLGREVSAGPTTSLGLYVMPGVVMSTVDEDPKVDGSIGGAARFNVRF